MNVTYTGKLNVGGSGIGLTAFHQVKPLFEAGILEKVYCEGVSTDLIPPNYFESMPFLQAPYRVQDNMFDVEVAMKLEEVDILQSWGSHCYWTMKKFPKATKIVNLYSAHPVVQRDLMGKDLQQLGLPLPDEMLLKKFCKELMICDHIFVPSEFILKTLEPFDLAHKATMVPFGVDLDKFTISDYNTDKFKVIFVGSNWARKGLQYLLTAWKKFVEEYPDADSELVVAGTDAKFTGLEDNVRVGWVKDLTEELRTSSLFMLPTLEDGCPLATYEAMACGIPVVVSNTTGTAQHIREGYNGFIISPANTQEIYDKLVYFYENRSETKRMGRNARLMAEAFPWERHEQGYLKFIKSI